MASVDSNRFIASAITSSARGTDGAVRPDGDVPTPPPPLQESPPGP